MPNILKSVIKSLAMTYLIPGIQNHSSTNLLIKKKAHLSVSLCFIKSLAMTYFRMGKPQTIIGAGRFHF